MWLIDKLVPYAKNPRTHSDAQVAQIAASIAEFGFNCPILVDTNAGIIASWPHATGDQGDIIFDPFLGSGTTMAAAQVLDRAGYGTEISPGYCDVVLRRIAHLSSSAECA